VFAFQNGQPLAVKEDSYLLIPMIPEETKVHEEVCYLGRSVHRGASPAVARSRAASDAPAREHGRD
jgi:hypothetical protein